MLAALRFSIAPDVLLPAFLGNPLLATASAVYGSAHKCACGIVDGHYHLPGTQLTKSVQNVFVLYITILIHHLVLGPIYRLR